MGEAKRRQLLVQTHALEAMAVDTPGGRIHVQWDHAASATPNAQLTFFAEFLATTGVYESWVNNCPLSYSSPNAHSKRDVLGTWLLAILAGHKRYAHITGLRGDAVSPQILGMEKIISEDALRRSLSRMSAEQSKTWLVPQLLSSVQAALSTSWILDIDTTIKPLYGKQSGAEVSYNPHKPGRPSHALHTYWVGNLGLVLDVVVSPGKEHSAAKARPGLIGVLDKLEPQQRPALVRGDCGFGNEPFIAELEGRAQPYLFKLRQTVGVKRLLARQFARDDWSTSGPSDQGWSAVEDTLKLSGWDKSRRVVVLRRAVKTDLALSRKTKGEQIELLMPDKDVQAWEYAVLVTNSTYALEIFGQLYRDRADCENGFDELKNQWGWGGFTTQDIERCQTSARAVALVYNWWSWYCRAAKPGVRMEAITSRALLLAGVGRAVKHAGQTTLYLTPMHAAKDKLIELITHIRAALSHVRAVAEQLPLTDRWRTFLDYVVAKITRPLPPWHPPDQIALVG
ncbi:transposase (plasmid) [Polaromonas sp. P1-6]|nr:transposase [Polaromonas sp. P1-6]